MQTLSRQDTVTRFKPIRALPVVLSALICLGLTLADINPCGSGSLGWLAGPRPVFAQEMVEPFEGSGPIDQIFDSKAISIGDATFRLADVVRFYKNFTKEQEISPTWFKVGTQVGFTVNQFGEIDEMWLE